MLVDVAETLAALAGALVEDHDVVDLTDRLVAESVRLLDAQAARLVVDDGRGGGAVLATAGPAGTRALLEVMTLASPAQDAMRTADAVSCHDLAAEPHRWPDFRPQALAAGLSSVLAVPMRRRSWCLGALCVYDRRPRTFSTLEVTVLGALTDIATIGLLQHRTVHGTAEVAAQLQRALDARVVIEQASGVLAAREGVPLATARERLREQARAQGTPLVQVAQQLVESTAR